MRKVIFLIIISLGCIDGLFSQALNPWKYDPSASDKNLWNLRRYEFTIGTGLSHLFGDIGGFSPSSNLIGLKDITLKHTRINVHPGFKYRITENITSRINVGFGYFHSTDVRGSNPARGFESATIFVEPSAIAEYHVLIYTGNNSARRRRPSSGQSILSRIDLYGFTGFGGLSYNVLPNEKLESYVEKKNGVTAIIPLGVGANLIYSRYFNFGLELGWRYAFSDYLDGYTSPYSKFNDTYYLLNVNLIYKIRTGANGMPFFK